MSIITCLIQVPIAHAFLFMLNLFSLKVVGKKEFLGYIELIDIYFIVFESETLAENV